MMLLVGTRIRVVDFHRLGAYQRGKLSQRRQATVRALAAQQPPNERVSGGMRLLFDPDAEQHRRDLMGALGLICPCGRPARACGRCWRCYSRWARGGRGE